MARQGRAAAQRVFDSLVESAKLWGVDPGALLEEAAAAYRDQAMLPPNQLAG